MMQRVKSVSQKVNEHIDEVVVKHILRSQTPTLDEDPNFEYDDYVCPVEYEKYWHVMHSVYKRRTSRLYNARKSS